MNSEMQDNADYPYSSRPAPAMAGERPTNARHWPWRSIWRWLGRAIAVVGVLLVITTVAGSIAAYRAARQAWLIAEIDRIGVPISYWHQPPDNQESLPVSWRERFGDRWWSAVREVSHDFFFFGNRNELAADDVSVICAACRTFPKLQTFSINSDHFSMEKISDWPHLDQIEALQIGSTRLSDADLAVVGRMTSVKKLKIVAANVSCEGINHLAKLPRLQTLTLDSVKWNVAGPKSALKGFSMLKSLNVSRSPELTDDAIACFGSPPHLEDVNFNQTPIGDEGLAQLLRSGKVRSLIIHKGAVTDAGLTGLANYTAPRWLVLSEMPLTDKGLRALAGKEFPTLILSHTAVTDEGFHALSEIKGLEYVSLGDTKVTGIGVGLLNADVPLKHLDLTGASLTRAGIEALAKAKCSELVLSGTFVGDEDLMIFSDNDNLIELDVTKTSVTAAGVRAFYKARKSRLSATGVAETLRLNSDFPSVTASILGIDPMSGSPLGVDEYAAPTN